MGTSLPTMGGSGSGECRSDSGAFPATHWSTVLAAGGDSTGAAGEALERLCRAYWYPLYAFARRSGHPPTDARDLTQGFFAELIEHRLVARADSDRGRFRTFLLVAFKRFLVSEHRAASAQKRGGGRVWLSLEGDEGEARFAREAATHDTPEVAFDRQWALSILDQALGHLEAEFRRKGREAVFARLEPCLEGDHERGAYAEAARALGTTEATIKVTVHRMRQRYRELLRFTILQTVESPLVVDEELRHLLAALRR